MRIPINEQWKRTEGWARRHPLLAGLGLICIAIALSPISRYLFGSSPPPALKARITSEAHPLGSLEPLRQANVSLPIRIIWSDPLRPKTEDEVTIDELTISQIDVYNAGGSNLEWDRDMAEPLMFRVADGARVLFSTILSSDVAGPHKYCRLDKYDDHVQFQAKYLAPCEIVQIGVVHSGPVQSLQIDGRQVDGQPLKWDDYHGVEYKYMPVSSAVPVSYYFTMVVPVLLTLILLYFSVEIRPTITRVLQFVALLLAAAGVLYWLTIGVVLLVHIPSSGYHVACPLIFLCMWGGFVVVVLRFNVLSSRATVLQLLGGRMATM